MKLFKEERFIRGLTEKGMRSIYPPRCLLCQQLAEDERDLCNICYQRLPWNKNSCWQCALPLAHDSQAANVEGSESKILCGRCQKKRPLFDSSYSLFRYDGEIVQMIHRLKFRQHLVCSRLLGEMLADGLNEILGVTGDVPDCLLPVPLHKKRLRQRGFNQSIELARALSKSLNMSLNINHLIRVRATDSQSGLDAKQRKKNIRGAFELREGFNANHVAIIDDVVTTTSTVNEIARVLKRNGVERVDVYSIARA